jgi:hypothetical protein
MQLPGLSGVVGVPLGLSLGTGLKLWVLSPAGLPFPILATPDDGFENLGMWLAEQRKQGGAEREEKAE